MRYWLGLLGIGLLLGGCQSGVTAPQAQRVEGSSKVREMGGAIALQHFQAAAITNIGQGMLWLPLGAISSMSQ